MSVAWRSVGPGLAALLATVAVATSARAAPQGNASVTIGGAAVGDEGRFWDHAEFHLGLRGDVMLLREGPTDFGLGPYLELGTLGFDTLDAGGGLSVHLPVDDMLPLVASVGAYARLGATPEDDAPDYFGAEPGIAASVFWGTRSYNYDADYVVTWVGLLVGYRQSFGPAKESALFLAAQFDLTLIGTPLVLLGQLAAGPSAEAETIEPEEP
ncbi:MAG: hypothetical protein IT373_22145 [Polyangiaceae bacterium]|nr:hypothetical protein [Polyangiaceae bacterium]